MQQPTRGNRVGSMILDHISMSFIITLIFAPFFVFNIITTINENPTSTGVFPMKDFIYFFLIGFALYLSKDAINGRSLAKRGLNLQVVNSKTEVAASPYRCLVRNLFLIIWPIEAIIVLINPSQRIGDLAAGTKVVAFDKTVEQPKVSVINVIASIAISYFILLPIASFTNSLDIKQPQADYSKTSFNPEASDSLKQYLINNLGEHYEPDVWVYDTISTTNDAKFISLVLNLNEDFISDDDLSSQLTLMVYSNVYTFMSEKPFVLGLNFIYKSATRQITRTQTLNSNDMGELMYTPTNSTLNQRLTDEIKELYLDSLNSLVVPKINVYDLNQAEDQKQIAYLLWVTPQGFETYSTTDSLHSEVVRLLSTNFPEYTFWGEIEYQYKESGETVSRKYNLELE